MHCEECGWNKRAADGRLPLELHHVNGNKQDNLLENLVILYPNCHSLKDNHRGLSKRKNRLNRHESAVSSTDSNAGVAKRQTQGT
jgi:hypothetical protein